MPEVDDKSPDVPEVLERGFEFGLQVERPVVSAKFDIRRRRDLSSPKMG